MYSFKQILQQEPNAIREWILSILAVLVLTGVVHISAQAVAGIGLVTSGTLGLFYVRQVSVSKSALKELNGASGKKRSG